MVPGLHRRGTLAHEYSDIGFVCLRDPAEAVAVPARAGSIVVFSSLTPHSTGPNRTDQVRKAYIVQYAPAGAAVVRPEPGGPAQRVPADDEGRQYEVLRGGERGHALGPPAPTVACRPGLPHRRGPPLPICAGRPIMTVVAVTEPSLFLVPVTPMKAPTLSAEALEVVPPPGPGSVLKVVLDE